MSLDPATKFHIKKWLITHHMTPKISHIKIGKIARKEGLYSRGISNKEIYANIFMFMKEHVIKPKENFPQNFKYPWLTDEEIRIREKPKEKIKTIDEIDVDIQTEINLKENLLEAKFNKEDFEEKDQELMLMVWKEKNEIILDTKKLINRLKKINAFIETYLKYY